jgi:hypothetical protein
VHRLYFDEDSSSHALVEALRRAGFDGLTTNEARMRGQADEQHLAFAFAQERVLFTMNTRDFRRLDATWRAAGRDHGGVIALTNQRQPIGQQLRAFRTIADRYGQEEMRNRFEFLRNYLQ